MITEENKQPAKYLNVPDQQQWQQMNRKEKDSHMNPQWVKLQEKRDTVSLEFRDIVSHGLLGSDTSDVDRETWNMIYDACADYSLGLKAAGWVKASSRLPLHKAHWNNDYKGPHDTEFPVRFKNRYYMGNIYDEAKKNDKETKYSISFNGEHHFENEFSEIEWLNDEPLPPVKKGK